jgi:hypothetical protein
VGRSGGRRLPGEPEGHAEQVGQQGPHTVRVPKKPPTAGRISAGDLLGKNASLPSFIHAFWRCSLEGPRCAIEDLFEERWITNYMRPVLEQQVSPLVEYTEPINRRISRKAEALSGTAQQLAAGIERQCGHGRGVL